MLWHSVRCGPTNDKHCINPQKLLVSVCTLRCVGLTCDLQERADVSLYDIRRMVFLIETQLCLWDTNWIFRYNVEYFILKQDVSRLKWLFEGPPITEARLRSRACRCKICGGQSGTGTAFSPSTSVFLCKYNFMIVPYNIDSKAECNVFLKTLHGMSVLNLF
jgi:hypothetical protein